MSGKELNLRLPPDRASACSPVNRAQCLSTIHRSLHPAPCGRGMRLYESALADVPVGQRATQSAVQLRMHWHKPRLVSLARTHTNRRAGRIERQVPHFEVQGLGDSQTGPPLLEHQQLSLRAGRCSDDGVHLVCFEVFRYAPLALGSCAVLCFGVTAMIPYGPSGIGSDPWGNWLRCLPDDLSIRSRGGP